MRENDPIITFVTLTYNQLESATKPFIQSLYKYTPQNKFELIIIDNASSDGTIEYLQNLCQKKSNVKVVYNKKNLGYSKGNNIGLKLAETEYVGLLNNDILLSPNWLEGTLNIFEKEEKVGLVAPQMLMNGNKDGNCLQARRDNYIKKVDFYKNKKLEAYTMKFAPQFSCVLMKKELIDKIGSLDENFSPAFFEDVDFMARTWMAGYRCYISNHTFFFHNHCQTSGKLEQREKIMEKNRKYLQEKNYMASELERLYAENSMLKYHTGEYSYRKRVYKWIRRIWDGIKR